MNNPPKDPVRMPCYLLRGALVHLVIGSPSVWSSVGKMTCIPHWCLDWCISQLIHSCFSISLTPVYICVIFI